MEKHAEHPVQSVVGQMSIMYGENEVSQGGGRNIPWKNKAEEAPWGLVNNMLHIPGYLVQRFGKIDVPAERFGEPLDAGGEFMVAGIEDNDGGVTDQGEDGPVVAVRDDSLEAGEIIKGGMEYFLSVRNDFAGRNIDGSVRLLRCDKLFQFPAELFNGFRPVEGFLVISHAEEDALPRIFRQLDVADEGGYDVRIKKKAAFIE